MSVILAFVTVLVLIIVGMIRSKKQRPSEEHVLVKRYVHPGHGWIRIDEDGQVIVGIDDFAQSLIGTVSEVRLPRLLRHLRQGSTGWYLWHGHRMIPMVSPVSGWVIEKNEALLQNPGLINSSPYGDGWLFKVHPHRMSAQLHNLLTGKAVHQWQDLVQGRLQRFFSGTPALMYHDGGVLVKDIADHCSDDEWNAIAKEFFFVDEPTQEKRQ